MRDELAISIAKLSQTDRQQGGLFYVIMEKISFERKRHDKGMVCDWGCPWLL